MKRNITALIVVFLLPLIALAGMYTFDTGEKVIRKDIAVAAAAGHRYSTYYFPDELGTTIDVNVDEVRGFIKVIADTGTSDVDTLIFSLEGYYSGTWRNMGRTDSLKTKAYCATADSALRTIYDLTRQTFYTVTDKDSAGGTNGYGLAEYSVTKNTYPGIGTPIFPDKYRFKVKVAHDSAAISNLFTYRIYGIKH